MPQLTNQSITDTGNDAASIVSEFSDGLILLERWRLRWVDYRTADCIELIDVQIQNVNGGQAWLRKLAR